MDEPKMPPIYAIWNPHAVAWVHDEHGFFYAFADKAEAESWADGTEVVELVPAPLFAAAAEARLAERAWISVDERKPQLGVRVLIGGTRGGHPMVEFARIVDRPGSGPAWDIEDVGKFVRTGPASITHWMAAPEPAGGGEGDAI